MKCPNSHSPKGSCEVHARLTVLAVPDPDPLEPAPVVQEVFKTNDGDTVVTVTCSIIRKLICKVSTGTFCMEELYELLKI